MHFGKGMEGMTEALMSSVESWLDDDQGVLLGEWAYSKAERAIVIEEDISPGKAPADYKFFTFAGKVEVIQVDTDRFEAHKRSFFDTNWNLLPVRNRFPYAGEVERPKRLETMLNVAERISADFDFLRVDLYYTGDSIWFGEVTPYPGGGVEPFQPRSFDAYLGSRWRLPVL